MRHITPGFPENIDVPKSQAKRLVAALRGKTDLSHAQSLEIMAKIHGQESWGHLRSVLTHDHPEGEKKTPPSKGDEDIVVSNVLLRDFTNGLWSWCHQDAFVCRVISAIHDAWSSFPTTDSGKVLKISKQRFCEDVSKHLPEGPEKELHLMRNIIAKGFDDIESLVNRKPFTWGPVGLHEKLILDGFRISPQTSIKWNECLDQGPTMLYTSSLKDSVREMMLAGAYVHDLSEARDWSRLCMLVGIPHETYAIGPTGLYELFFSETRPKSESMPTQVVVFSLRECVNQDMPTFLALARHANIQVIVHWDVGFEHIFSQYQRRMLAFFLENAQRSIAHIPGEGPGKDLWTHG